MYMKSTKMLKTPISKLRKIVKSRNGEVIRHFNGWTVIVPHENGLRELTPLHYDIKTERDALLHVIRDLYDSNLLSDEECETYKNA